MKQQKHIVLIYTLWFPTHAAPLWGCQHILHYLSIYLYSSSCSSPSRFLPFYSVLQPFLCSPSLQRSWLVTMVTEKWSGKQSRARSGTRACAEQWLTLHQTRLLALIGCFNSGIITNSFRSSGWSQRSPAQIVIQVTLWLKVVLLEDEFSNVTMDQCVGSEPRTGNEAALLIFKRVFFTLEQTYSLYQCVNEYRVDWLEQDILHLTLLTKDRHGFDFPHFGFKRLYTFIRVSRV